MQKMMVIALPSLLKVVDWIEEETEGVVRYLRASVREYPWASQLSDQLIVGRFQEAIRKLFGSLTK